MTAASGIYEVRIGDERMRFFAPDPDDHIQQFHRKGELYEFVELQIIASLVAPGSVICDVGSSVGNHAIYFSQVMKARQVYVFEPNPDSIAVLKRNVELNAPTAIALEHLGIGISDQTDEMYLHVIDGNVPASRLLSESTTNTDLSVKTAALDSLIQQPVDLIKIDVEGMELRVLRGAQRLIDEYRPSLFVEVNTHNQQEFDEWYKQTGYEVRASYRRYRSNCNYFLMDQRFARPGIPWRSA